jgi:hypothetical protein
MTRRYTGVAALVIFALSLAYFGSYMKYGLAYDEGYLLDGVERIMAGQVIYRDFHHTYAPGRFYLLAAAFGAFGKNILVERLIFALLQAVKCSLAFLIVKALVRNRFAFIAPVLIMIAPGPWHKVFFSAFGFLAVLIALAAVNERSRRLAVYGALLGGCAVFRQDTAGFAFLGAAVGMLLAGTVKGWGLGDYLQRLLYLAVGAAIVAVGVFAYFGSRNAVGQMVHKITRDGMIDNMTNRIPYPGLASITGIDVAYLGHILPVKLLFYLPFVIYGLAAVIVARGIARRTWDRNPIGLLVVLVVSVFAFNQSVWRSDVGHLFQTMQFVYLLVPVILAAACGLIGRNLGWGVLRLRALAISLGTAAALLLVWATYGCLVATTDTALMGRFITEGVSVGDTEYVGSAIVRAGNTARLDLDRARVYVRPGEARFFGALKQFIDTHTSPGDFVLAVPQLQMLYFFYDRRNPTDYAHYRRALDPAEEYEYIRDIASAGTEYVFLVEPFEGARLGQTKQAFSEYAGRVRTWILENYTEVERIGSVRILRKRT